ncbi:MAG: S8 family serine peptidase, partial [Erysipelotrichaceae bacterium]|nr:S8 family serine peptidase [Erysipelotrichaceae bacterium]
PDVKVAVIDSGVQENHEELAGKVVLRPVGSISTSPSNAHGTHVAGIIAGSLGNGAGGAGIAPETTIYSYNVFRGSSAAAADIAEAILLAAEDGAWIMNLSFGTVSYSQTVQDAVTTAYESGSTMFAAMGNYGTNVKCYPAGYDHVIGVAAVGRTGGRAAYSCYGDWCDISAPGSEISSSYYSYGSTSSYRTMNGTSMASPVAAGSAALYMSAYGYTSPDQMERIMKAGSSSVNGQMGAGIVSLKKLFGEKESAPIISFDSSTNKLSITAVDPDDRAQIIYTLDGRKPAVRNRKVVCGDLYTGETDLSGKPYNTILTVKAAVISGTGMISDISSLQIRTGGPAPSVTDQRIDKISLINTSLALNYSDMNPETAEVGVKAIVLEDGSKVDLSKYQPDDYQWYSDNEQIAVVDENGIVTAAGKGETYIWLKISFQNSVKKAKCRVTVKRLSESISVSGRNGILPGKTLQMKAVVWPKTADNRKTVWSIAEVSDPVYQNYVSIDKTGLLSVKKGIPEGTVITVKASAKDGSGAEGSYAVTVCHKVTSVSVLMDHEPVRSVSVYAVDLPETDQTDNSISLSAVLTTAVGEAETRPIWTSSQPKVAKVTSDGEVTAMKAGTTVITCKASDGSGKKASVKVKVTMPTSGIFLTVPVKNVNIVEDINSMVIGKSCQLTAVIGKVYGKPSVSTVKWSLEKAVINGYDCLDTIKEMKLIKISKTGKITVSSKLLSKLGITNYSSGYIIVQAETMDGTGHYDQQKIYLQELIRSMTMSVQLSGGSEKIIGNETIAVSKNKTITLYADFDHKPQSVTIKSSDPDRCGPRLYNITRNSSGGYRAEIKITGGMTAGRSMVTITENGSGMKAVVNIRTKES